MSMDSIDDLEAAEELIDLLEVALRDACIDDPALRAVAEYCRPTCDAHGEPHRTEAPHSSACGCPCHG